MNEERNLLQRSIIGAVLLENMYPTVHTILTEMNFQNSQDIEYHAIWKCIKSMYPNKAIDIVTVSAELLLTTGQSFHYQVVQCTHNILSASNLHTYAFQLLELDIKTRLVADLVQTRIKYQQDGLTLESTAIESIIDDLQHNFGSDIIQDMYNIKSYIEKNGLHHCKFIKDYCEAYQEKCTKIKNTAKEQAMLNYLIQSREGLVQYPDPVNRLISATAKAMKAKTYPLGSYDLMYQLENIFRTR